jgi:transposase
MLDRPDTLVQEDNAPSHASHFQQELVYNLHAVLRLLWPGNSPDLNMIEPCWMWMKRETTKRGAPSVRKEAEIAWRNC